MKRNFKDVRAGDVIICYDPLSHDYEEYELKVDSVEVKRAADTGNEEDCIIAYGKGLTRELHEYIEDMGYPLAITENEFVCFGENKPPKKLTIFEIIDNLIDELSRTEDLLSYEDTKMTFGDTGVELLSDIREDLDRAKDIKERIEFALILAVYAGENNKNGEDVDFSSWRQKYIEAASGIDFSYNEDGKIASDAMFNIAADIVSKWFE